MYSVVMQIQRLAGEYQQQVELVSRLTGLLAELPALDTEVSTEPLNINKFKPDCVTGWRAVGLPGPAGEHIYGGGA